jgi:hypothetical protein
MDYNEIIWEHAIKAIGCIAVSDEYKMVNELLNSGFYDILRQIIDQISKEANPNQLTINAMDKMCFILSNI